MRLNTKVVVGVVASVFGILPEQIINRGSKRYISDAKKVTYKILREVYGYNWQLIADEFKLTSHSTPHYQARVLKDILKQDAELRLMHDRCMQLVSKGTPVNNLADLYDKKSMMMRVIQTLDDQIKEEEKKLNEIIKITNGTSN